MEMGHYTETMPLELKYKVILQAVYAYKLFICSCKPCVCCGNYKKGTWPVHIWPTSCETGPSDISHSVDLDQPENGVANAFT